MNVSPDLLLDLIASDRVKLAGLNPEQLRAVKQWAADDRLWTTPDTVAFNLAVFARVILAANR